MRRAARHISSNRIQFPTLQQHERDTYYDAAGQIVYAKNHALTGVGVSGIPRHGCNLPPHRGGFFDSISTINYISP